MTAQGAEEPAEPGRPEVGSVAEEAWRLIGAWSASLGTHGHAPDDEPVQESSAQPDGATATGECAWCPVCRTAHVVREATPELREHLGAALGSLGKALIALSEATRPEPGDQRQSHDSQDRPGVQRIDLDSQDDWEDPEKCEETPG